MSWFMLCDYIELFKTAKPKIGSHNVFRFGDSVWYSVAGSSRVEIKAATVVVYDRMLVSEQGIKP